MRCSGHSRTVFASAPLLTARQSPEFWNAQGHTRQSCRLDPYDEHGFDLLQLDVRQRLSAVAGRHRQHGYRRPGDRGHHGSTQVRPRETCSFLTPPFIELIRWTWPGAPAFQRQGPGKMILRSELHSRLEGDHSRSAVAS